MLATVILTRIAWIMFASSVTRWVERRSGESSGRPLLKPSVKGAAIVSWSGMRGIVTLAAALALPQGEHPFPGRDLLLVTAFVVVLGTLVIQGMTLRPLLRAFDLRDDAPVERETALARQAAVRAALVNLEKDKSPAADALRR